LILEPTDSESDKKKFKVERINLDDCALFPGSKVSKSAVAYITDRSFYAYIYLTLVQEWIKYALTKFKENYAFIQMRNHRDSNQEWVSAKVFFGRAKKHVLEKKARRDGRSYRTDVSVKNATETAVFLHHNPFDLLKILPEMCFVSVPGPDDSEMKMKLERDLNKKAQAAYMGAKRKLISAACDVVRKELKAARDFEILSMMNLSLNHMNFKKATKQIEAKRRDVHNSLADLRTQIKESIESIEMQLKEVDKLENSLTDADKEDDHSPAQLRLKRKRIDVESTRLSTNIAERKVEVAKSTAQLFEAVAAFEKATAVHAELMIAKAEARVRSRVAKEHSKIILQLTDDEKDEDLLLALTLDEEDTAELDAVQEPSVHDLRKAVARLGNTKDDQDRKVFLEKTIKKLERQELLDDYKSTDLSAETQIARARVDCEIAEKVLWEEWLHCAIGEETDKPAQGKGCPILVKAGLVDAANSMLRAAVIDATKTVDEQARKFPPYTEEAPGPKRLSAGPWIPLKEAGNHAQVIARLERPAERALAMSRNLIHGPTGKVDPPTSGDLREVVKELDELRIKVEKFASRLLKARPSKAPEEHSPSDPAPQSQIEAVDQAGN
jgi:hypothetical protein